MNNYHLFNQPVQDLRNRGPRWHDELKWSIFFAQYSDLRQMCFRLVKLSAAYLVKPLTHCHNMQKCNLPVYPHTHACTHILSVFHTFVSTWQLFPYQRLWKLNTQSLTQTQNKVLNTSLKPHAVAKPHYCKTEGVTSLVLKKKLYLWQP